MKPISGTPSGVNAYRALLTLAFEHKSYFGLAILGMVVFAATDAAFAYIMKPILDEGFIERDPFIINLIPIAIILIFTVRMVAAFLRTYCMDYIGRNVINSLRETMFEKLLSMTSEEYDQSSSGAILSRFSYDVEKVANSVSNSLTALIQDSLRIVVLLVYMVWLNWQLTLIFLLAGPIVFIIVVKVSGRFRSISRNIQTSIGDVSEVAQEVIDANRIVKIFGGAEFEREKFNRLNLHNLKLNLKMSIAQGVSMPLIQLIMGVALAAIIAFATSESMHGIISTGDFVSFIFALTMILQPMRVLSRINAQIQQGIAAGESIFKFTTSASENDEGQMGLERSTGLLSFRNLSLKYRGSENLVLDGISFEVKPNQTIAIVGRSGSGKSSLVNLIPRLYEIDGGDILLDNQSIRNYRLQDLRRQIAYVGQDVRLFNDTIRNNIAYGISDKVSDDEILKAAKQAHAWEFIRDLPDQLDTMVGERGILLSGGQRQRIAIARALLKDAPILILDEATSALDTESERYIQHAMENLMDNRTTLVIAHRLSTIEHADHILVLDQGKLIEQGSHQELLVQGGMYATLHSMQFSNSALTGPTSDMHSTDEVQTPVALDKTLINHSMIASTQKRQGAWLWSMNPLAILLMPLSLLFYMLTVLRRLAYRSGILHSKRLAVSTIVVGNITLGGNGKTPVVVALYQLLKSRGYHPAIITRGYKSGNEKLVQLLAEGNTDVRAGDEANMMSEICQCPIGVGANRVASAQAILSKYPEVDVILSDDGLQHYKLQRDIEIAVCRYVAFGNGLLIPAGPLREAKDRLRQVDLTINRDSEEVVDYLGETWNLLDPNNRKNIADFKGQQVHAVAGIGFPEIFFSSLEQIGIDIIPHEYPDHHDYSARDLDFKSDLPILVTHKDAVKLRGIANEHVWVVPLTLEFNQDLQNRILQLLETKHHG